jgi:hypothetical protein
MGWLEVEFEGATYAYDPGTEVTFGRAGMIAVGPSNTSLHRIFGHLTHRGDSWRLTNVGARLSMKLTDEGTGTTTELTPNGQHVLTAPATSIMFTAGDHSYELLVFQSDTADNQVVAPVAFDDHRTTVSNDRDVHLSPNQRLLLVALCERRLRNPLDSTIPPSGEVALRLGMSLKRFNKVLGEVCLRFAVAGYAGVYDPGGLATSRRNAIVDAAISDRLVRAADLATLPSPPSGRTGAVLPR